VEFGPEDTRDELLRRLLSHKDAGTVLVRQLLEDHAGGKSMFMHDILYNEERGIRR